VLYLYLNGRYDDGQDNLKKVIKLVVKDEVEKQSLLCEQTHVENKMFDMKRAAEWLSQSKNSK